MKKFRLPLLSLLIVSFGTALVGCSDETQPDPEIAKSRDEQRQQMAPGQQGGGTPTAPPGAGQ